MDRTTRRLRALAGALNVLGLIFAAVAVLQLLMACGAKARARIDPATSSVSQDERRPVKTETLRIRIGLPPAPEGGPR